MWAGKYRLEVNLTVWLATLYVRVCVCVYNHLMLELAGVSAAHRDDAAINVEFANDGCASFQLRAEGLRGAATQAQQADQDVLLRVLVGEERLPAAVCHIVPPHQLHLGRHSCLLVHGVVFQKTYAVR